MIESRTEPRAELTIAVNAVAMNSALPSPHTARKATTPATESCMPARPAPAMITTRPINRVRLTPRRLETTPVISIASPMTAM